MKNSFLFIDLRHMLEDFEQYDAVKDKYDIDDNCNLVDSKFYEAILYAINRDKINEREFRNFDYERLKRLTKVIYGEDYQPEMIQIISLVQEKFIKGFLNIPHLDDLFSEHYFEYEWEMHSKLDSNEAHINFYRDHYFHQIRNLYELFKLFQLKELKVLDNLLDEIEESTSNTARYCAHAIDKAAELYFGNGEIRKNLIDKLVNSNSDTKVYFKKFARSYIVRGALYVAALTHDIGYPIVRQIQRNKEFIKFLANPAYSKNIFDFDNIRDTIEKSLLFGIVGADEIKKHLSGDSLKMDHGIVSAIVLLTHFYDHGAIYDLDPLKRAIIELAAIVIYDHTSTYKALKDNDYRENYPRWKKNPLSVIFRLADDIQEWDRVYFEVKPYSNIRICPECKMPMLKKEFEQGKGKSYIINEFTKYRHICGCKKEQSPWNCQFELEYGAYKQQMSFNNQKINYVIACNRIYFKLTDDTISNTKKLKIILDYNPYKLFELLTLTSTTFHEHRLHEIKKLGKFLEYSNLNNIEVSAFIHFDPKILIGKIVYDFLAALSYLKAYKTSKIKKFKQFVKSEIQEKFDQHHIYPEFQFNVNEFLKAINQLNDDINKSRSTNINIFDMIYDILNKGTLFLFKESCIFTSEIVDQLSLSGNQLKCLKKDYQPFFTEFIKAFFNVKDENILYILSTLFELIENDTVYETTVKQCKTENDKIKDLVSPENYMSGKKNSETTNFYSSFYVLGMMNDFTEMCKDYFSQEVLRLESKIQ